MTHEFIRFIVPNRTDPDSGTAIGIVAVAYELAESDKVAQPLRDQLASLLRWIERNVSLPRRFNRTKSKGWYRRNTRGISWLRVTADEHLGKFRSLADVVKQCGCNVTELRETRIGYITHEDAVQAVAEPFRETRTR
jgi:16S rRNA U516 pseudouridylate synthase RsuA-like enzyme